mgnify:CR=1 FL=1
MKKIICFYFVLYSLSSFCQDTLCLRGGEKRVVKITEIHPEIIKYKNFDNLNGPTYSESKNQVNIIKYFGGQIDTFNIIEPSIAVIEQKQQNKLSYYGKEISYNQIPISIEELGDLINKHPDSDRKKKMKKTYLEMKSHGKTHGAVLGLGLAFGFGIVLVTAPFVTGLHDEFLLPTDEGMQVAAFGILNGAAIRISCIAFSHAQRNKKKAKIREIVSIYNGDYDLGK